MKKSYLGIFSIGVVCSQFLYAQAGRSDLVSPSKRAATVELARKLNERVKPSSIVLAKDIINPFNPPGFDGPDAEELAAIAAAKASKQVQPRSSHDLLVELASQMSPTGSAILGGESFLLFGQKKMKVGDKITITFEGGVYEVEVTSIERTNFTIRLNRDEYTRPIKPGKNP